MDAETKALIERLSQRLAELEGENWALREENRALKQRLDEAERAANRQAAPFRRRDSLKKAPGEKKRPGRPKGHEGATRAIPDHVDEVVEVKLTECPHCRGHVSDVAAIKRFIEELPRVRAWVTKLTTYLGTCARCGVVYSSHPLQTAPGPGGSPVQIGPRALAAAAMLNKQLGVPMRKSCAILKSLTGLRLTPGGLAQALHRAAGKVADERDGLVTRLRQSAAVFADETSWWVDGPGWWLWTFTNAKATVYRVEKKRGSAVVTDTLGDFQGMLVSDCLASYDPVPYRKHKCIAHHQRAIAKARERPDTEGSAYLKEWKHLFQIVSVLHRARSRLPSEVFAMRTMKLREWAARLLLRPVHRSGEIAVRNRLAKQIDHLFGCLDEPTAEPTNNRAERALRPAVIARKISCGNRTEAGKRTWEILASLAETCRQNGDDFLNWLAPRLSAALSG
jgi:transposase